MPRTDPECPNCGSRRVHLVEQRRWVEQWTFGCDQGHDWLGYPLDWGWSEEGLCLRCDGSGRLEKFNAWEDGTCFHCRGAGAAPDAPLLSGSPVMATNSGIERRVEATAVRAKVLGAFLRDHGEEAWALLKRLRDEEPERYEKAIDSLGAGRGDAVARALREWAREA